MCHRKTKNLKELTLQADILIVAVGQPEFVKADMVKDGAVVVDVGIHRIKDNSEKGYHIIGDVAYDDMSASRPLCMSGGDSSRWRRTSRYYEYLHLPPHMESNCS